MVKINMKKLLFAGMVLAAAAMPGIAPEPVTVRGFFTAGPAYAAELHSDALDDAADLLTDTEEAALLADIEELEEATGWTVFVLTAADAGGRSAQAYADAYVDTHAFEQDGICYLIDVDNREVAVSTTGKTISIINDRSVEDILDAGYDELKNDNYKACFRNMMEETEACYGKHTPHLSVADILIALAAGLAAGGITGGIIVGSYRLKFGTYQYDYKTNSRLRLAEKEDRFVNEFVTHRHIESSSSGSSGGGSTTHKSSGGGTHGGGSRKF